MKSNMAKQPKRIVVIGGGTGTYVALTGLKRYDVELSAVITMADSGGSSGKLRDEYGVLPPGDIRQCLVALSESDLLMRDLFLYRYSEGTFKGQNFGNIFISTLEKMTGSIKDAIEAAGKILAIRGKVLPVTTDKIHLHAELEDGKIVEGETHIDEGHYDPSKRIRKVFLVPQPKADSDALEAIRDADLIVIGPGDLYTSIIPNLLVAGIPEAIKSSQAKKAFVMNLMTKCPQTTGLSAKDHLEAIEKYLGKGILTHVLINNTALPKEILTIYEKDKDYPVIDNITQAAPRLIRADLIKNIIIKKEDGDSLKRSLIRHDPNKLAKALMGL